MFVKERPLPMSVSLYGLADYLVRAVQFDRNMQQ
jgi:hypothetical protein